MRRNTVKSNRRGRGRPDRTRVPGSGRIEQYNHNRALIPPRWQTTMTFHGMGNILASPMSNTALVPTFLPSVDPNSPSGTPIAGYLEYAGLYRQYRTIASKITLKFYNREAYPVTVWLCPFNNNPGVFVTAAAAQAALSNPLCRKRVIGPTTGDGKGTIVYNLDIAKWSGAQNFNLDDNYSGTTTALVSPLNNVFWVYGVITPPGTVGLAGGVYFDTTMDMTVQFFEPANPQN